MKKNSLIILGASILLYSCSGGAGKSETSAAEDQPEVNEEVVAMNELSEKEEEEGWVMMFDGASSSGWRNYGKETFPEGWVIADGMLHCPGSGRGEAGGQDKGDIIFGAKQFGNFHLKLEWKISEGGNSGIFYLGQEREDLSHIWKTAPEMQILDNDKHPDAMAGKDGNRQAGALYDLIPAVPQNSKPAGEWNAVEIMVYKGSVWHKMNGETVLEYHLWTPEWEQMVAGSKFPKLNKDWVNVAQEGYIGLQDHGDDVWFRNIKIREL